MTSGSESRLLDHQSRWYAVRLLSKPSIMLKEYLGNSADVFSLIGAITTGAFAFKITWNFIRFVIAHFLSGPLRLSADLKKAGSWAVVTGCTDGIGKAYAEQLAKRGLNVVLISRTMSKLEDMAKQVEEKFKVSTRVIATDFSKSDIYDEVEEKMKDLDIGVLINNVGMSYDHPEFFGDVDSPDFVRRMINMNCVSVAKMTQIVLPKMVEKRKGYIINVGSSAGSYPTPLLGLYSGTKAFVDYFSQSLQAEYGDKGLFIQSLRPYFVVSKLSKFRKASLFIPSPTTFVNNALSTVGIESVTTGFWAHSIQGMYISMIPTWVGKSFLMQARKRALAKKAAANKSQ